MKIEEYNFGKIRINGKDYTSDIIITPLKIIENWWRRNGHKICLEDLKKYNVLEEDYDHVVIGTGYYGMVEVLEDVKEFFKNKKLYILPTKDAVQKFNELVSQGKKILGMFHLTC